VLQLDTSRKDDDDVDVHNIERKQEAYKQVTVL
jgi:hypothetical protein